MTESVTTEYNPNNIETWALNDNGKNVRVYIQAPPAEVDTDCEDTFLDEEEPNLTVATYTSGEVEVFVDGVDPQTESAQENIQYEGEAEYPPVSWIESELDDRGHIEFSNIESEDEQEVRCW